MPVLGFEIQQVLPSQIVEINDLNMQFFHACPLAHPRVKSKIEIFGRNKKEA
jgi:hypothetical protein